VGKFFKKRRYTSSFESKQQFHFPWTMSLAPNKSEWAAQNNISGMQHFLQKKYCSTIMQLI
jgi:hypothetical protein